MEKNWICERSCGSWRTCPAAALKTRTLPPLHPCHSLPGPGQAAVSYEAQIRRHPGQEQETSMGSMCNGSLFSVEWAAFRKTRHILSLHRGNLGVNSRNNKSSGKDLLIKLSKITVCIVSNKLSNVVKMHTPIMIKIIRKHFSLNYVCTKKGIRL